MTQSTHTAKPLSFYISNEPIDQLARACGDRLEKLTAHQKCLLGEVIYNHMANANARYTILESLCNVDGDKTLGDRLWDHIKSIANDSDAEELAGFQCALSAFIADDARGGAFD